MQRYNIVYSKGKQKHKKSVEGCLEVHNQGKKLVIKSDDKFVASQFKEQPAGFYTGDPVVFEDQTFQQDGDSSTDISNNMNSAVVAKSEVSVSKGFIKPGSHITTNSTIGNSNNSSNSNAIVRNTTGFVKPSIITTKSTPSSTSGAFKPIVRLHGSTPAPLKMNSSQPMLKSHQIDGITFLTNALRGPYHGAILGDDMGLGKSVQAIKTLDQLFLSGFCKKALLVCPLSLVGHWEQEYKKWGKKQDTMVFTDLDVDNLRLWIFGYKKALLICSYESYMQKVQPQFTKIINKDSIEAVSVKKKRKGNNSSSSNTNTNDDDDDDTQTSYTTELPSIALICDEAHRLKGTGTKILQSLVSMNSKWACKLLLTGTPIQNNVQEFVHLLHFAAPSFKIDLTTFHVDSISPIFLRRTSEQQKDIIPPCTEYRVFLPMTPLQQSLGKSQHKHTKDPLVLILLQKYLAIHPRQLTSATTDIQQQVLTSVLSQVQTDQTSLTAQDSSKMAFIMQAVTQLLQYNHSNPMNTRKMIIVSTYREVLHLVQQYILQENPEEQVLLFDGSQPIKTREDVVMKFQKFDKSSILLLSTSAGGTGQNLTRADTMIMLDCHWNATVDAQTMGRIARPGQTRPSQVYRLFSDASIDEAVLVRQLQKTQVGNNVLQNEQQDQIPADLVKQVFRLQSNHTYDIITKKDPSIRLQWMDPDDTTNIPWSTQALKIWRVPKLVDSD